ncbi:MAG: sugar phosphate isomerase/epimerase [bacterium]|nr:sugar phosphate isomerase/epimerase [bacterium]
MKLGQLAAQCYTVRDFLKTPAEIAATLKKIRAIGYPAVQLSALGPIDERELAAILDGEGLVCCATHESSENILQRTDAVIERLLRLRCRITAYPYPAGIALTTHDDVIRFSRQLNEAGRKLHAAGITLCYHNHHIEFRKVGGKTILEILFDETDPRYVQGEPDTYWIQYGGGDPVAWCHRLRGRLPIIHLKDYMITAENTVTMCEIGTGTLDWSRILPAAEAAGCQWFVVEQDTCPGDPFESLRISLNYLKELSCGS